MNSNTLMCVYGEIISKICPQVYDFYIKPLVQGYIMTSIHPDGLSLRVGERIPPL